MRLPRIPVLPTSFWVFGALLLAMDAGLVVLYLGWKLGIVRDVAYDLGHDNGAGEVFQYTKMLWIGLCAAWMAWRTCQPIYGVLSALFLGLLVDDAAMLHERLGVQLAETLRIPAVAGLEPHDFGEIGFVALWVGPLFLAGMVAYRFSDLDARALTKKALWALGALAAFGIGADVLHQIVTAAVEIHGLHSFLTVVEEGGEMVVMSFIAASAIALTLGQTPPSALGGDGQAPHTLLSVRIPRREEPAA